MAFLVSNKIKTYIMQGSLDFREAGDDLRLVLVMTNTTTDTEDDIQFIGSYTTLDEYDGGSRPRRTRWESGICLSRGGLV